MGSCAERLEMHYKFNGGTSGQPSCSRTELCTRLSRKKATILGSVTELPTATYAVISQTRMMAFSRLKLLHPLYSWCWTMRRDSQWTVKFLVCSDPLSLTYHIPYARALHTVATPYMLLHAFFQFCCWLSLFTVFSCFVHINFHADYRRPIHRVWLWEQDWDPYPGQTTPETKIKIDRECKTHYKADPYQVWDTDHEDTRTKKIEMWKAPVIFKTSKQIQKCVYRAFGTAGGIYSSDIIDWYISLFEAIDIGDRVIGL